MTEPALEAQRVLVTGAAGFIGFHLALRLLAAGATVHGLDNLNAYYDVSLKRARLAQTAKHERFAFSQLDITDYDGLRALLADFRPDCVVHLAAQAGVRHSLDHPRALHQRQPRRLPRRAGGMPRAPGPPPRLCLLELGLWGQHQGAVPRGRPRAGAGIALRRHQAGQRADGPDLRPPLRHSLLRRALLHGVRALGTARHGLLRLHQGHPGRTPHRRVQPRAHAARFHLHRRRDGGARCASSTCRRAREGPAARHQVLRTPSTMSATTRPSSWSASSARSRAALGRKADKRYLPMQPGDVPATWADVERLARATGFAPKTTIEDGIARFVAWYRTYHGTP